MKWLRAAAPAAVAVILALVPLVHVAVPALLPGPLSAPGTLQLLAVCFVFGALALSYDLLFGFTGLLSFGHALYFAAGVYGCDIALSHWGWSLGPALGLTAAVGVLLPLAVGAISLRVSGIAFAMVTLAFAQAGSILAYRNPAGATGGEEGLGLNTHHVPAFLVGVANTRNLYWLALVLLVVEYAVVWWATRSRPGRVWEAIRENERRVTVLGIRPYTFKLAAFVLGSLLATVAGIVYLFLQGGATPQVTTPDFTLSLLVMVVLGGAGFRWGAVLGGVLYTFLDQRLGSLAASHAVAALPPPLRVPLSQPLFLLGLLFILLVVFLPGGIAGVVRRVLDRGAVAWTADNPSVSRQVLATAAVSARGPRTPGEAS
jgi:branched-chain amino acid transport system permease protein